MPEIRPPESTLVSPLARPNTFASLGPSYAANGVSSGGIGPRNYLGWACLYSGGKMRYVKTAGAGGYKVGQIKASSLPSVLALDPKPGYCILLLAGNDAGVTTLADVIADATDVIETLAANGIMPVVCAELPNTSTSKHADLSRYNAWYASYCAEHKYPFVNWRASLVNPADGTWLNTDLASDGIHPTGYGAKVMGELLWLALKPYLDGAGVAQPYLTDSNTDPINLHTNGLQLTDTDSNGVPDGWSITGGASGVSYVSEADAPNLLGNWFKITRSGSSGTSIIRTSSAIACSVGDVLEVGFRIKADLVAGSMALGLCGVMDGSNTLAVANEALALTNFTGVDVPISTFYNRFATSRSSVRFQFVIDSGDGELWIGQPTIRNLTAQGLT